MPASSAKYSINSASPAGTTPRIRLALLISAATVAALPLSPARAQTDSKETQTVPPALATSPDSASGQSTVTDDSRIEEIVVIGTKRGRGEVLQKAAVSATALGEAQIDKLFAANIADLGATAPNVQLKTEGATLPGTANFYIRGTGVAGSVPSDDPAVAVVIDGMPLGTTIGVLADTFDLEGVEIYRGPQGTLFGRNATGGAVLLRSRRPNETFGVRLEGTVGSFNQIEGSGSIEGTLATGLTGKIAALYKDRDGYLQNVTTGGRQGAQESLLIRPMLRFRPRDGVDFTLIAEYGHIQGDGPSTRTRNSNITGSPSVTGKFQTSQNFSGFSDVEWRHVIGEANIDVAGGTATSITAYRETDQSSASDADGLSGTYFNVYGALDQRQFTQELRWSGSLSEAIHLTTGVFYFSQSYDYRERRQLAPPFAAAPRNIGGGGTIDQKAAAIFAEGAAKLLPGLELVLGGRYTYERKQAVISTVGIACPTNPDFNGPINYAACVPNFRDSASFRNFTPKVGLNYQIAPNAFGYASWSRGFRSGGFNVRSTNPAVPPGPYQPEKVDAYEAGLKLDLADRRLRVNTAVYYNKFDNLQRTAIDNQARQTVLNAAEATIWGVESEITASVARGLTLSTNVGYTNASYNSFLGLPAGATRPIDELMFVNVPEWTVAAAANYSTSVSANIDLSGRVSYRYVDKVAYNDINTLIEPSYSLVDANLSLRLKRQDIELSIFGRNIFNTFYNSFAFNIGQTIPSFVGPPATYGLRVSFRH